MAPRNKRCRHILKPPQAAGFMPGISSSDNNAVVVLFEEYEALRLADYEQLRHDEAAALMRVSRPTFARMYESVRQKLALAFVESRSVVFSAGCAYFQSENITSKNNDVLVNLINTDMNKIVAIPCEGGVLSGHFGHAAEFAFVLCEGSEVKSVTMQQAPPHEPGLLPRWVAENGANVVIAGGMGSKAVELFRGNGVDVLTGAPGLEVEVLAKQFVDGKLTGGDNRCDH